MGSITVIGLGPGDFGLITMDSWERMQGAEHLYFRTEKHPTVPMIKERGVSFVSYDSFYEGAESFEALYEAIARDLVKKAASEDLVYAVPGSPMVAEKTVVLLREYCREAGIELDIQPGMSFVEVLYSKLGIDPIEGMTIIDAEDFDQLPVDMPTGLVITQVYNDRIASDTKLSLMEVFPDEYPITYIHKLGMPDESIRTIELFELDRQPDIDYLTSLYVPPFKRKSEFDITPLKDIVHTLRSPGGCPWDIAQTHESIRTNLIEETYEVIEAIDLQDPHLMCEELGDLLLQVVFHARMAEETGDFSMQQVIDEATEKLVRRHPHIFGDVQAADAGAAVLAWESIKKKEKKERQSVLDGVPKGLPALMSAQKLQHKAAKVGFDWDEIAPVWDKIKEEVDELKEAQAEGNPQHIEEELGDVLFTVVNLARFLKVDAELALMNTNRKFTERFHFVENKVKESGKNWSDFTLNELDELWNMAKLC
ncbi:Nucleoside triphosphate pyrophosphohydrolase MazG [Anaerovibrio sp. JC8]|uniref:nucleoside triphosphate pyrophosphohydrolase n=1 Tax=Anaerovibrio sp. JC8 TaxID=1240085 RepID=UPI000A09A7E7|nr:nucleoside triphosphate pyrophosphohydrolase [Anaerovibrio sp. JC8]ORU00458.1 Nucleoside triphosphate pyrophosphohydrolase MazG [Anaerovibrio sp. JC8]